MRPTKGHRGSLFNSAVDGVPPPRLLRRAQLRRPFDDRLAVDHRNRCGEHRVCVGRVCPGDIILPDIHVVTIYVLLARWHSHSSNRIRAKLRYKPILVIRRALAALRIASRKVIRDPCRRLSGRQFRNCSTTRHPDNLIDPCTVSDIHRSGRRAQICPADRVRSRTIDLNRLLLPAFGIEFLRLLHSVYLNFGVGKRGIAVNSAHHVPVECESPPSMNRRLNPRSLAVFNRAALRGNAVRAAVRC